jgi:hypothetical protein
VSCMANCCCEEIVFVFRDMDLHRVPSGRRCLRAMTISIALGLTVWFLAAGLLIERYLQ